MRRRASALAAGGLLVLPAVLAFSRGGYFDAARIRAGIAACVLAAVGAVVADRSVPAGRAGRVALAGMAALTAWTALSLTWAPLRGPALADLERLVLYLAALVAAAALLDRRWTEPALLAGIVAAAGYGLSERLLPGLVSLPRSAAAGDRLAQPLTYWNAQGALAAVGLVLAAGLVAESGRGRLRVAAAASAPLLGLDLYLTLSRGALGAIAAGLLVLLALRPERAALEAALLVAIAAAIPPAAAELVFRDVLHTDSGSGQGAGMLVLLVAATIAAGAVAARPPRPARSLPRLRPLAAVALAAALTITVVAAAHSGRAGVPAATSGRLVSIESNRYAYWRVALATFADHPLRGVGSAGYRVEWLERRHIGEVVRDAHSLYLETAAELGLVGLLALAALFGGTAAGVRRETAVAAAALAAWAVHAGVDWDWEMPALTLVAVLLAGRVIGRAPPRT
jgi:O-antigen ligase